LYASPNIIRIIKSRRTKWAGYIVRMWVREMRTGILWQSQKEIDTRKTKT
jgi:hypothetical protein